jgi:hypothetical protein
MTGHVGNLYRLHGRIAYCGALPDVADPSRKEDTSFLPADLTRCSEGFPPIGDEQTLAALNERRSDLRRQTYGRQLVGKDWGAPAQSLGGGHGNGTPE